MSDILTLPQLLERYTVEVPIVQRDYAQGRTDDHASTVRANLLRDMKRAVLEGETLDLNFVYGKAEGKKFIPLDGQQRLTTLFLLHLYAFRDDPAQTGLLQSFTYETRVTSRTFLKQLIANRSAVLAPGKPPSREIEDAPWFVSSWQHDPTVQSVLVMLDAIAEQFAGVIDLAARLTGQSAPPITFQFLDMQALGMEDSLYIKLNARGKPLTDFENFKARLLGRMKQLDLPGQDAFERSFDGPWTDLFWADCRNAFDQAYYAFFGILLMNRGIIEDDKNWANSLDYEVIGPDIFQTAACTLDYLSASPTPDTKRIMLDALKENRTYTRRVLFHAVCVYLLQSGQAGARGQNVDPDGLFAWVRIFKNLALNTEIDSQDRYRRALRSIDALAEHWSDIVSFFCQKPQPAGFNQQQAEEEGIKASIIAADPDFAQKIYAAEKHSYFSGQIRSALYPARQKNGSYDKAQFERYWLIVSGLFEDDRPRHGHLLRRALLTLGDYTLNVGPFKTLCVDDPGETAKTPSMKTLFSQCGSDSRPGPIVRQLLNRLNPNQDLKGQLEQMVQGSQVRENDWRACLIRCPALFNWMSASHLRLREQDMACGMHLIKNKWANGYNYNLFLSALYEALQKKGIESFFDAELGTCAEHYLLTGKYSVWYDGEKFCVKNCENKVVFQSTEDTPIQDTLEFLCL